VTAQPEETAAGSEPESLFKDYPAAIPVLRRVRDVVRGLGPAEIRATRTQVAFRRKRGFAYLWTPSRWLRQPSAEVVLSIARRESINSPRFKQIAHPARSVWMHHLEVHSLEDLDDEVLGWLRDAYAEAG
jgi:hypothetical protein